MKSLILILLFITCNNLYAREIECTKLLSYFELEIKTKGYKGWQRVCNNEKLYLYTKKPISEKDKQCICN